ncbi:MAG: alpha/beta fold hydrolase [Candidatus Aenigmarchaeota archaeon]|nr:alpha/beta fold hydrolase [Candidatus Aenigmarchaeota archaeon]
MQEKLFFRDSRGNRVCGIISATDKNRHVIILCHGFASGKHSKTHTTLEKMLNEKGISTLRFDFFGHGESEGRLEDLTISRAVDDIMSAIALLKKRGYSKFGLVGSSFGGAASILAASKAKLFVLALKAPVSDFEDLAVGRFDEELLKEWKRKGIITYKQPGGLDVTLRYGFFDDMKKNNGYEAAKRIKAPTIIVHGDKDDVVSIEQSRKTAKLIKNCRLEIIKGAGHDFAKPEQFEKMVELITGFIVEKC